ncbi:MAG: DUF262 domain-containing protein [Firmicutes bacterium]|nr:DUF262 domain-containing protein [Bacillota bacterium]
MSISKMIWTAQSSFRRRKGIDTNPDYQRPAVWTRAQKQLLIDSMLRDYDVPKFYLHRTGKDTYDVIDGQQRLRAIWEFFEGGFALAKDAEDVNGCEIKGKKYDELDFDMQDKINSYNLDFVVLDYVDDDEIREMFLRLQNGTSLKAQEKRNAMPGRMGDFVRNLAKHPFFTKVYFSNSRFTYDLIAAQMTLLYLNKNSGICNIKDRDLNVMYESQKNFDESSSEAKAINRILDYLDSMFPSKAPELKRYSVISLFILLMDLMPNYDIRNREQDLAQWFIEFENMRAQDELKEPEQQDPKLVIYHERVSNSSDTMDSLTYRHNFLKENLLASVRNLPQKDPKRNFDDAQRQVIFRRDKGICQACGRICEWNDWEADHIIPWSKGGKTEVENGQVLCPSCNSKKKDQLET